MNFYKLINRVLKEQETQQPENPQQPAIQQQNSRENSLIKKPEDSALPSLDELIYVKLIKIAVASLFTEVEEILQKNVDLRSVVKKLKSYRPVNPTSAIPALKIIQYFIKLGGNPVEDIFGVEELDFATQSVLINLIINCLFSSKKELENSDPSISSLISKVASDYNLLSRIKDSDPETSVKTADEIKSNIEKILSTTTLQFV